MPKTVLTGVQATGTPHIGNLLGAIWPMIKWVNQADQAFVFIADLHGLNSMHDPKLLRQYTLEVAAVYMAMGLDLKRAAFFRQSDVPITAELATILTNVTPKGLMDRAHSYKDVVAKNLAAGHDADLGVNMGLYNYPILMTADILLYDVDVVPVGKDQKQHLEFARDIAGYFNNMYGDVFKLPIESIREDVGLIPGLDGRKMSKSYGNQIPIFDSAAELEKKIMKIATDSLLPEDKKNPDESVIYTIYREFATPEQTTAMRNKFLNGKIGYGDAKKELFAVMNEVLAPRREVFNELMSNPDRIMAALEQGATRARPIAEATIARVRKAVGL